MLEIIDFYINANVPNFSFLAKPKPVSAAVRKRRMNFRLRKVLTPKSPLMVLNEIVGGVTYDFVDNPPQMMTPGIPQPHLFTAQCTVTIFDLLY